MSTVLRMRNATAMAGLALLLSACAGGPFGPAPVNPGSGAPVTIPTDERGEAPEVPRQPSPSAAATGALLEQSRNLRDAGNLGSAAATLERALAIAPEDPLLWVELAEVRLDEGNRLVAEEMAQKALTLTPPNSPIAARARRLIGR